MKLAAWALMHGQGRGQGGAKAVHQGPHGGTKQAGQGVHAQACARQPQLLQRAPVGAHDAAVSTNGQDAFHQRSNELHAAVKVQPHDVAVVVREPAVFNHAR